MCVRVQSCCCGCTLRCGAITAAVITFLSSLFSVIIGAVVIIGIKEMKKEKPLTEEEELSYKIIGGVYIAAGIFTFVIFVCLAYGINQKRPRFLMPWLVLILLNIVAYIINIITAVINKRYEALTSLIYVALVFYLWVVVYSFYKELQENEDGVRTA